MSSYFYKCLDRQEWVYEDYGLKVISPVEIETIRLWRNMQMDILRQAKTISKAEQEDYFSKYIWPEMDTDKPKNILLCFYYKDIFIGYGGLVHIAWEAKRAEISFLLNNQDKANLNLYGKHFMAFLKLIKNISFLDLRLEKIFTETYAIRPHHIELLESSGMVLEGVLRNHVLVGDKLVNSLMHGILKSEYEK
jgi:RimJ/RimL family protein N-acetyltransferase